MNRCVEVVVGKCYPLPACCRTTFVVFAEPEPMHATGENQGPMLDRGSDCGHGTPTDPRNLPPPRARTTMETDMKAIPIPPTDPSRWFAQSCSRPRCGADAYGPERLCAICRAEIEAVKHDQTLPPEVLERNKARGYRKGVSPTVM